MRLPNVSPACWRTNSNAASAWPFAFKKQGVKSGADLARPSLKCGDIRPACTRPRCNELGKNIPHAIDIPADESRLAPALEIVERLDDRSIPLVRAAGPPCPAFLLQNLVDHPEELRLGNGDLCAVHLCLSGADGGGQTQTVHQMRDMSAF